MAVYKCPLYYYYYYYYNCLIYLFAAESGRESRLTHRPHVIHSDTMTSAPSAQRSSTKVSLLDSASNLRRPADYYTSRSVTTSSRGPATEMGNSVTDGLSDRDVEIQQQMFISELLDRKSASRRHTATQRQPPSRYTHTKS